MKKLILFSGLLIAGLTMNAQGAAKNPQQTQDPAVKANKATEKMAQELSLTADQKTKVYNINLSKANALEAAKQKDGSNQQAFADDRKVIQSERDKEIKAVLTVDQATKWEQMKTDKKASRSAQHN